LSTYRLGTKGVSDPGEIFDYTVDTCGEEQAENYLDELARCFHRLADSPGLGRTCDRIYPGIRRFEQGKHVIFYKPERHGIVISRILHQKRLPNRLYFIDAAEIRAAQERWDEDCRS
jgi:toxin ParE1/3/4